MTIGIYIIKNNIDNKIYIGSSKNTESRFRVHKSYLRNNKHANKHLQRAWNLNGGDFSFSVIEVTSEENRFVREQFYIDFYGLPNENIGYNFRRKVENNFGIKHSKETRVLLSNASKRAWNNPKTKEKFLINIKNTTIKRRKKIIELNSGEIFESISDAAKKLNIPIRNISAGAISCCSVFGFNPRFLDENNNPITRDKFKKNKEVKNIETNEIFKSITEASEKTGLSETSISRNCKKTRLIGGKNGKWLFEFV